MYDGLGEPQRALELLPAGVADPAGGRRPGRRGGHPVQHRDDLPRSRGIWTGRSPSWSRSSSSTARSSHPDLAVGHRHAERSTPGTLTSLDAGISRRHDVDGAVGGGASVGGGRPGGGDRPGCGDRVGRVWLARSRFADVARLAELTLTLGEDAGAFYHLGWAKQATGFPREALAAYEQALAPVPGRRRPRQRGRHAEQHRPRVRRVGGVGRRALDYYEQALPIRREVGDRAGEATTLNNIGAVYDGLGRPAAGAGVLPAGAADPPGGRRPGRRGRHAEQHRRACTTGWGTGQAALDYYEQALPIRREVGDRAGEATTLNNIGAVYDGLGERAARWTTTSRRCRSAGRSATGPVRRPR